MKLTLKLLNQLNACVEGIDFIIRYNLLNFPLERLDEIQGDYNSYIEWCRYNTKSIEFDTNGNVIKYVQHYMTDVTIRNVYDEKQRVSLMSSSLGFKQEYKYDDDDNIIAIYFYDEDSYYIKEPTYHLYDVHHYTYDENKHLTSMTQSEHVTFFWHYNEDGTLIRKDPEPNVIEFYPDGQLKQLNSLTIPFFEKDNIND
jgi:hypothetical protein